MIFYENKKKSFFKNLKQFLGMKKSVKSYILIKKAAKDKN